MVLLSGGSFALDLATRAYNHSFRLDPIVRSLLDTDFYKLLMLQLIWRRYRDTAVTFRLVNRSSARLADQLDVVELRAQLDHARTVRLGHRERLWLAGNSFYGDPHIFEPDFLDWLSAFRLPDYVLERGPDGDIALSFHGPWAGVTLWEIPALAILSELRARRAMQGLGRFELDVLYARAKARLWSKVERLQPLSDLALSDFGTRRRHGFLWQRWCVEALREGLGDRFIGTSNTLIAMETDVEAVGTNGHELPMVLAALAPDDETLRRAPYAVLRLWEETYGGKLRVALPDAFGTAAFLRDAPEGLEAWTGFRPDSAPPIEAGEAIIAWWLRRGQDPRKKLLVFSDALQVEDIVRIRDHFHGRVRLSFGWGTHLTNDFAGCAPRARAGLEPLSLVIKVTEAAGRPAVKLSDNLNKATGDPAEVARYRRVFGSQGAQVLPLTA